MNTKALFVAILEDETVFVGGKSYEKTLWLDIPNKKIKRLFYSLPDGDHLCLSLYDRYFHFVEATQDLSGKNSGTVNLEYAYILGEKEGKVICSRYFVIWVSTLFFSLK
jgi:hypothetical protein